MRWEITVTTHLFVTCRTGFHSAAGEVASRPGRGGRAGAGAEHPAAGPGRPGCRPAGGLAFANRSFGERADEQGREGKGQRYPALARSAGDEVKLARRGPARPGRLGRREAVGRDWAARPTLVEPGLGPGGPGPQRPG